jgi:putative DNA methylase
MDRPTVLAEQWLPVKELGIESVRERAMAVDLPPLFGLHVWWARRPLVASAGAVLASVMPIWTPDLAKSFSTRSEVASGQAYHQWFLRLCGILGDPVLAKARSDAARAAGRPLADNPFAYKQAHKNSPTTDDLRLLHALLKATWGRLPEVSDPTAGGGSIPYEAIRYGLPSHANDLNSIAAAVLRAGVELPARFGEAIVEDLERWGKKLCRSIQDRLAPFFPDGPNDQVANYIFARTVACPRTGKPVPLAPNWWLSKDKGGVAVYLVTHQNGEELDTPIFEIVRGKKIDKRAADNGTITRGEAVSPWDSLVIDADYIKAEAKAGRMGSVLYAVAVRTPRGRDFRIPTATDLTALRAAEDELARLLPQWEVEDILPTEGFPHGNDMRPVEYGMPLWRDMFSPRQLLVHGTFVEEYRRLIPEVRGAIVDQDRADAVLALLGMLVGKAVPWNCLQSRWDQSRDKISQAFDQHAFPFRWTFAEFEGARELYPWCLDRGTVRAFKGIASALRPGQGAFEGSGLDVAVPGSVSVTQGNAGDMPWLSDGSVELVCIDPPYYDNVMYAELADFFYVWEKRTLSHLWPDLFRDELTNKEEEAVANKARFEHAGRRARELATLDYERKMTAIFTECRRVLRDDGVMTVMFTHKKAEAWDTLGQSLLEAGFAIEASWPVATESEQSLSQAQKNSAASTIFLVCRKRPERTEGTRVFFDRVETEIRVAAREAYKRFTSAGMDGVDRLLATYGPTLSVLSEHWPVYSSEPGPDGQSRLLRPEEALLAVQEEVARLQRNRLVASHVEFDPLTDFWLLAWDTFKAQEFPFDEARKLALAVGGVEIDDLARAKLLTKKTGTVTMCEPKQRFRRDADSDLPGVNRERITFPALVDALHTALYVADLDGAAPARTWLEHRRLVDDARFRALVEAAVKVVPRVRERGELVLAEAVLLERLVLAAFPNIHLPEDVVAAEQGQFEI